MEIFLTDFSQQPVLIIHHKQYFWIDGETIQQLPKHEINKLLTDGACPLLCHRKVIKHQLGISFNFPCLDILEWISFCNPTLIAPPTIAGIAKTFDMPFDKEIMQQAIILRDIAHHLQNTIIHHHEYGNLYALAQKMQKAGWEWTKYLPSQENMKYDDEQSAFTAWQKLPEWQSKPILPPHAQKPPDLDDITNMLKKIIAERNIEMRDAQHEYSHALAHIFQPRFDDSPANLALVEAYTGTGKTLGYLLPSYLYAVQNNASVWVSTYSKNLQHQIYHEAKSFHDNIIIRKGRENYLCLLNFQQAIERHFISNQRFMIGLGLVARWITETKFGDMNGDDFPAWLEDLFDHRLTQELADRRYGCIHQLCPHYKRCFVEMTRHNGRHADIIVSNHALSLTEAESGAIENNPRLNVMIFDEAHHLFQAADNFYAVKFNGIESTQLKQWFSDSTTQQQRNLFRPIPRGFRSRLGKFADHKEMKPLMEQLALALDFLPEENWCQRILNGHPRGEVEIFLQQLNLYVVAYGKNANPYYNIEAPIQPTPPELSKTAHHLTEAIKVLIIPIHAIGQKLQIFLEDSDCEKADIIGIERIAKRLEHFLTMLNHWYEMINDLAQQNFSETHIDWLMVKRKQGISYDFEFCRHAINPMQLLSDNLLQKLNGFAMTSATLFSHEQIEQDDLATAIQGVSDFPTPLIARYKNDFDYQNQTRIFIATDIKRQQAKINQAYLQLFLAAKGGSLGLFTSIKQLKTTHQEIIQKLSDHDIQLYAQHIDKYSVSNLVEIFKHDENACLLGTDSLRDGIDVPGRGLRQVILDKMPWPRPDILTSARQQFFGRIYSERLVRFRLKQAFGRLIRHKDDKGVFILLDSAFPSQMQDAFPENVIIERTPINELTDHVQEFLES